MCERQVIGTWKRGTEKGTGEGGDERGIKEGKERKRGKKELDR